jgi:hypothetical protein
MSVSSLGAEETAGSGRGGPWLPSELPGDPSSVGVVNGSSSSSSTTTEPLKGATVAVGMAGSPRRKLSDVFDGLREFTRFCRMLVVAGGGMEMLARSTWPLVVSGSADRPLRGVMRGGGALEGFILSAPGVRCEDSSIWGIPTQRQMLQRGIGAVQDGVMTMAERVRVGRVCFFGCGARPSTSSQRRVKSKMDLFGGRSARGIGAKSLWVSCPPACDGITHPGGAAAAAVLVLI